MEAAVAMTSRCTPRRRLFGTCAAVSTLGIRAAFAESPRLIESRPADGAVMEGRLAEYLLRFDMPIDHYRSRLLIIGQGGTVAVLHPRLESPPEVLFAEAPELPAGGYMLHWLVRSVSGGDVAEGAVPFTVRR